MSSAQELASIRPGQVVAGRYRVERQLGQGGMGSVFLVQHVHTDERLALKLLHATVVKDAATLDRFRREARTPARIDSDHVVRVTDADVAPELDNVPFLVMEYLRGEDLEQLAERRGEIPPSEVVLFLGQVARALDKAHQLGIVHRDLKPENLFLTQREDGTPCIKVLDFGIAKMTGGDVKEAGRLTTTGQIFGTPLYMSPEQAMAEGDKISPQTDVWALGLIAHRLLTGKEFWTAQTLTHLVAQIAFEPIPPPSARGCALGPAYDEWFAKCCARPVEARFKSAGEAVGALAAALAVTDSPSMLSRLPVSVRVTPSHRAMESRDALAETRASDVSTTTPPETAPTPSAPGSPRPPSLAATQFAAESAKPGRMSKTLGYVIGGTLAILAGGIAAWKYGAPPAGGTPTGGTSGPAVTAEPSGATGRPGPTGATTPLVTPSAEVSAPPADSGTAAIPTAAASSAKVTVPTSATGKPTGAPSSKPTATASATATAAPTVAPSTSGTATKTADPLGTRY